jgi:probable rRNA maturation factor
MSPDLMPDRGVGSDTEWITVDVHEQYADRVDAPDIARAVAAVLQAENREDGEVTVVVASDAEVAALNRQYLGEEGPTDVLSFPTAGEAPVAGSENQFVAAPEAENYLGDIIIAFPYAERQAASLGRSTRSELRLLAVHGALHLLGYDHVDAEEEKVMWARQDAILASLPT